MMSSIFFHFIVWSIDFFSLSLFSAPQQNELAHKYTTIEKNCDIVDTDYI